jgi:hypothetical protein
MSMCFDVTGFTKNNKNARKDLGILYDRPSLEAKTNTKVNLSRPHAPYCFKLPERKEILKWLKILKLPDRCAANIK